MDIIFILKALLLAILEALTEFLPVSSTGHLILFGELLAFPSSNFSKLFNILIQFAAILAVMVHYRKTFLQKLKDFRKEKNFWLSLVLATLPIFVFAFLLDDWLDTYFMNPLSIAIALIVGALLLLYFEKNVLPRAKTEKIEEVSLGQAIKVGLFQCLALFPGMSRSASTLIGAWHVGLKTPLALDFSFYMAVPALCGASAFSLIKFFVKQGNFYLNATESMALGLAFVLSFVLSLVVIRLFLNFVKQKPLRFFAYYRLILASIILSLLFFVPSVFGRA